MKKVKPAIIYAILILLCIVAFGGYFLSSRIGAVKNDAPVSNNTPASSSDSPVPKNDTPASSNDTSASKNEVTAVDSKVPSPAASAGNPVIGVGRGDNYSEVTRTAVKNAGGLERIIKKGDSVLIKPNICTAGTPGAPTITDYRMVEEIVKMCKELGAGKITIGEGPIDGLAFDGFFGKMNEYYKIPGVELVEFNSMDKQECYEVKPDKSVTGKSFYIPKVFMDADVVISAPKLKTHFQPDAVVSLCLKNMFGVPPAKIYGTGFKSGLHDLGLKEAIVDLNKIRKADLYVIDGIVGGEGYGPLDNTAVDSKIIFAGTDPVAMDTVASTFMGFNTEDIPHLKLAAQEGLGVSDPAKIKVVGADIDKIKMKFNR